MSEEKLYVLKNDEGEYWEFNDLGGFWELLDVSVPFTVSEEDAKKTAKEHGGHIITLIEEPKKVVLTKEQAEIVEGAHEDVYPAAYIYEHTGSSRWENHLMNAYVNGYTVEKDKKYNVKVPKNWSGDDKHYWSKEQDGSLTWACLINKDYMIPTYQFTLADIEHYGLQDCEKEEVTDVSNETKRWYVKTPDNWMGNEKQGWLYKITGVINTLSEDSREYTQDEQFTAEEIKKYHLDGFEKEEVTDDEQ